MSAALGASASPGHAQSYGRVSLDSEYRSRGYQAAGAEPVATFLLGYDDVSGVYASGLAIAGTEGSDIGLAGFQANLGYAGRISPDVTFEAGVLHTRYAYRIGRALDLSHTEIYAGFGYGRLTARAYFSPDYFARDRPALYTELEDNLPLDRATNLGLHFGTLTYLGETPDYVARTHYDWRATMAHDFGPIEAYASLSGSGPGADYPSETNGRVVVSFGTAIAF